MLAPGLASGGQRVDPARIFISVNHRGWDLIETTLREALRQPGAPAGSHGHRDHDDPASGAPALRGAAALVTQRSSPRPKSGMTGTGFRTCVKRRGARRKNGS